MDEFKQFIKYYILLALDRAGVSLTSDNYAELDAALEDLETGIRRIVREEIATANEPDPALADHRPCAGEKGDTMPQQIALAKIELVQSRAKIDTETIEDYAHNMRMGTNFPAIRVVDDGETCWCYDGCHRTLAARQAKRETILASVHKGTRRDAVLWSCGVSATNGMRRTNEDKRRAVQILLDDPEWAQWSSREIAR